MWDTNGMTKLTTLRLPRLVVVPYAVVEWLSKQGRTSNELRIWLETMMRTGVNFVKEDWGLFFEFSMAAEQMDTNEKKELSCPWKWNQSPSQTQNFGNGQTRDWMLHWEQGQQYPQSKEGAAHHRLISPYCKTKQR